MSSLDIAPRYPNAPFGDVLNDMYKSIQRIWVRLLAVILLAGAVEILFHGFVEATGAGDVHLTSFLNLTLATFLWGAYELYVGSWLVLTVFSLIRGESSKSLAIAAIRWRSLLAVAWLFLVNYFILIIIALLLGLLGRFLIDHIELGSWFYTAWIYIVGTITVIIQLVVFAFCLAGMRVASRGRFVSPRKLAQRTSLYAWKPFILLCLTIGFAYSLTYAMDYLLGDYLFDPFESIVSMLAYFSSCVVYWIALCFSLLLAGRFWRPHR